MSKKYTESCLALEGSIPSTVTKRRLMAKKNIITIDLDVWTTPAVKARELGLSESIIRQRIHRTNIGKPGNKPEKAWYIDELKLVLVKR